MKTEFLESMAENEDRSCNQSNDQKKDENKPSQLKLFLEGGSGFKTTTILAKPSTKVYKLLDAYCKEHNVDPKEYRLIYKDKVLHLDERLESYNFPSESTINVVASQTGGFLTF